MRNISIGIAAAAVLAFAAPAYADTATGDLNVTLNVTKGCSLDMPAGLDFGYKTIVGGGTGATANATVNVTCTSGTSYALTANNGLNASGTQRRLSSGGATPTYVNYTLTFPTATQTANGVAQAQSFQGDIASTVAAVPVGTYTDKVTVTLTF
ncbi:MAG: spore coat protein U domain-containing protein [Proteobacteria bacterium]|nr:spore coat protein U domain-containing protein [Pseudomonadota bacterium]